MLTTGQTKFAFKTKPKKNSCLKSLYSFKQANNCKNKINARIKQKPCLKFTMKKKIKVVKLT